MELLIIRILGALLALVAFGAHAQFAYVCLVTPTSVANAASSACGNRESDAAVDPATVKPSYYLAACADTATSCGWDSRVSWRRFDAVGASALMWSTPSSNPDDPQGRWVRTDSLFGVATQPLPPAVDPPPATGTGTMSLKWVQPTTNQDGSPIGAIVSNKVYWADNLGPNPGAGFPNSVTIQPATAYVISNLPADTWYAAVTAITANGESGYSNIASKVVEGTTEPPVDPPVDPCVADPLTFSVQTWPSAHTGRRSVSYTKNKPASVLIAEDLRSATATDARGCRRTVTR